MEGFHLVKFTDIQDRAKDFMKTIGDSAYVLGTDDYARSLAKRILELLNIECIEKHKRIERTPRILVFSCQHTQATDLNVIFEEIEEYIEKLKEQNNGRIILLTNGFERYKYEVKYSISYSIQKAIVTFFKQQAIDLAKKNITFNNIEIGYFPERDNSFSINNECSYFRRLAIRRYVELADIKSTMSFLLSESSRFMTGETIVLDGGLEMNQVTPPIKEGIIKKGTSMLVPSKENQREFDLTGKVAIVFGCSSGIGKATVLELAKRGARISLIARRKEKLEEIQKIIDVSRTKSLVLQKDVKCQKDIENAIIETWQFFGKIDIFIYVAGIGYVTDELNDENDYKTMYETNYMGYSTALKMIFKKWKDNNIRGVGLGVSTIDVNFVPSYGLASYSVTKAAMTQLTKNLSLLGAKYGIRLNCIAPGYIDTEIMSFTTESYRNQWCKKIPMGRLGNAEDISGVICFLVSAASDYLVGKNLIVDGGYSLIKIPELVDD